MTTSEYVHTMKQETTVRTGGGPQVVEHLPNKCEALSSNPNMRERNFQSFFFFFGSTEFKLSPLEATPPPSYIPTKHVNIHNTNVLGSYNYNRSIKM
jgi:hypothetical protein